MPTLHPSGTRHSLKTKLRQWLTEPLLYFSIGGAAIYGIGLYMDRTPAQIRVDREALLTFIQQRSSDFDPQRAELRLRQASDADIASLVDQFVIEEALYREAVALGYADSDYVLKRRLVQKLELNLEGFASTQVTLSDAELQRCFKAQRSDFQQAARYTFAHVFLGPAAEAQAAALLESLNERAVGFNDGTVYGQRFPYHSVYVDRDLAFIASHFGDDFTATLSTLAANDRWQGPVVSEHGVHLVMLSRLTPALDPQYEDVKHQVERTCQRLRARELTDQAIQEIVDKYRPIIDFQATEPEA